MTFMHTRVAFPSIAVILLTCVFPACSDAQTPAIPAAALIQPADLATSLKSSQEKPLIIQVGFHVLYTQAHIPGSEYIGPCSRPEGIRQLQQRVEALPRTQPIVLYCGCCPWSRCPNIAPAYQDLQTMGFKNVKLLYIADNFGKDWVAKGYPVAAGD